MSTTFRLREVRGKRVDNPFFYTNRSDERVYAFRRFKQRKSPSRSTLEIVIDKTPSYIFICHRHDVLAGPAHRVIGNTGSSSSFPFLVSAPCMIIHHPNLHHGNSSYFPGSFDNHLCGQGRQHDLPCSSSDCKTLSMLYISFERRPFDQMLYRNKRTDKKPSAKLNPDKGAPSGSH